jgi:hypothetical protein
LNEQAASGGRASSDRKCAVVISIISEKQINENGETDKFSCGITIDVQRLAGKPLVINLQTMST